MSEIENTEKQETVDEVFYADGVKVISGRWVDAEKAPGVAKARWVLRSFEEKAAKDDWYTATASLVAGRLILVWALTMRAKTQDSTFDIGDIKGAFLHASIKDGEGVLA